MFKEIFSRIIGLLLNPANTWVTLRERDESDELFLSRFAYPVFGLIAAAAFLGVLFSSGAFSFEVALKSSIKAFASSAGGFFVSSYLVGEVLRWKFKRRPDQRLCRSFVGYASSAMFVTAITLSLLPEFFFLYAGTFYTLYLIWAGTRTYIGLSTSQQTGFWWLASIAIMLPPIVINSIIFMLMPGLKF